MVVMADYFLNPQQYRKLPDSQEVYEYVRDAGYGIIKMPPAGTPKRAIPGWVSSVVDQIQEYGNRDFRVLLLGMNSLPGKGIWLPELKRELSKRGIAIPAAKYLSSSILRNAESTRRSLAEFLVRWQDHERPR